METSRDAAFYIPPPYQSSWHRAWLAMLRQMDNGAFSTGIELPGHLTFNPTCRVNEGGYHDEACAYNYDCLRRKDAPLFPPGLGIDQMDTPEVALRLELQKRSLADTFRRSVIQDTAQPTSGYPRPSEYWNKKEAGFPRPSQYWGAAQKAPSFQGQNFGASKYWDKPQQASEALKSSRNGVTLRAGCLIPRQRLVPVTNALGLPASAQSKQAPRRRNPLGRIVEEMCGVARQSKAEIFAPKPIRPCVNPQATSQMSAFLARFTPETAFLDPIWARACLLHVEHELFPRGPEMFGGDESSNDGCDDEECCGEWENWVEKWVMENGV